MNYETIEALVADVANAETLVNNVAYDDTIFTATGTDWLTYRGAACDRVFTSGNSWFGLGSPEEHLRVNRRTARMRYLYREEGTIKHGTRFLRFRWSGYTYRSSTTAAYKLTYDVILLDDGRIVIHLTDQPTSYNDGVYSLTADTTYTYTVTTAAPWAVFTPDGAGGYILTSEPPQFFDVRFLIQDGEMLYTASEGLLEPLEVTAVNAETFLAYGFEEPPAGLDVSALQAPRVLYWQSGTVTDPPALKAVVTAEPPEGQTLTSETYSAAHESIKGILQITADAASELLFQLSADDGATWKRWDGTAWVDDGEWMDKLTMQELTQTALEELIDIMDGSYKVRCKFPGALSYIANVVVKFVN